jgi:hypothetical protein
MTSRQNLKPYGPFRPLLVSVFLMLWAVAVQAAPSIEVQIGFSGHVLPDRYAPVRIRVRNYDETAVAKILVTQTLGSPWRGSATVLQEPNLGIATDSVYRTTIPLYDPLNPIFVSLMDDRGATLAEQEVDLRSTRHLNPVPVIYGTLPFPLGDEASPVVTATELPEDWWAYDVAESLWISTTPRQESWNTIARWVFAGGTIVLLSGPDYFRFDSPVVRNLLPLTDPALVTGPDGGEYLIGTIRSGTQTFLRRDGIPLLLVRPYGAGHVALVAVTGADLTRNEVELIAGSIPASTRLTLTEFSEAALATLPVVRPSHLAAILLVGGCVVGLGVSATIGRKRRKGAAISLLVLFALLSVLSGLYANADRSIRSVYTANTRLSLHTSFGLYTDSISFLWSRDGQLSHATPSETVPIQTVSVSPATDPLYALMPHSQAFPAMFEHSFLGGRISAPMRSGTLKTFSSCGTSAPALHLTYHTDADLLVLDQDSDAEVDSAWFILDGLGFHVQSVPQGTTTYSLDDVHGLHELAAPPPDGSIDVLKSLSDIFPFDEGVWFVGQSSRWVESGEEAGRKVRLVTLHVVEGERND